MLLIEGSVCCNNLYPPLISEAWEIHVCLGPEELSLWAYQFLFKLVTKFSNPKIGDTWLT